MTHISVHYNVAQPVVHACRVLDKGVRLGHAVCLVAPADALDEADRLLWTLKPDRFVPHVRVPAGASQADLAARLSPIWLLARAEDAPAERVLVSLLADVPQGFERAARLIDVVGQDEAARAAGRVRWRHYSDRGYPIERLEVGA